MAQFLMIERFITNCNYIFRHDEEQKQSNPKISNSEYLRYIARLVSDDTVIILYKILKDTQHHSFQKLNSKVNHLILYEGFEFASKKHQASFEEFKANLDTLIKLYIKLDYEGIRNKYAGHLDMNRKFIPFQLDDLKKIKELLLIINSTLHNAFYDFQEPHFKMIGYY